MISSSRAFPFGGRFRESHAVAERLHRALANRLFNPLWTTSNGKGGYHIRIILEQPVPTRDLHHLLKTVAKEAGFKGEQFPKQPLVKPGKYGNWLRAVGLHHTSDYWSQVFAAGRWLAGQDAVEAVLRHIADPDDRVPTAPEPEPQRPVKRASSVFATKEKLDRRIASYVAKCPNRVEGEGRDDIAFHISCFLVRDMQLSDDAALMWLEAWDSRNLPPKGKARLEEIIQSAHTYGQKAYGSGLRREGESW